MWNLFIYAWFNSLVIRGQELWDDVIYPSSVAHCHTEQRREAPQSKYPAAVKAGPDVSTSLNMTRQSRVRQRRSPHPLPSIARRPTQLFKKIKKRVF